MYNRLRGYLPQGSFFVLLLSVLAVTACESATASDGVSPSERQTPRMFTGVDSAYVVALEARIASLEAAVALSTNEASMRINNTEVLRLHANVTSRDARFTGQVSINPISPDSTGLSVTDSPVYFGSNGFDAVSSISKNETALRLTWGKGLLLGGVSPTVAQVYVGEANSAGTGYRILRILN